MPQMACRGVEWGDPRSGKWRRPSGLTFQTPKSNNLELAPPAELNSLEWLCGSSISGRDVATCSEHGSTLADRVGSPTPSQQIPSKSEKDVSKLLTIIITTVIQGQPPDMPSTTVGAEGSNVIYHLT